MAKKSKNKPAKGQASEKPKKRKNKRSGKVQIFLIGFILLGAVFLPTAVLLTLGMMPSMVAYFTDKTKKKTRAVTVMMINFAGCMPFLVDLWTTDHTLDQVFAMIFNTIPLLVMYTAAAVGYLIDWAMTYIVANLLYQRGKARIKSIEKKQKELIERWGKDVTKAAPKRPDIDEDPLAALESK